MPAVPEIETIEKDCLVYLEFCMVTEGADQRHQRQGGGGDYDGYVRNSVEPILPTNSEGLLLLVLIFYQS